MQDHFKDLAIILTWPDATIRGDEKWMMFFKKIGFVKNLNFKVGHTGIIIINHTNGEMLFYDFGRYITPRGHGRARSQYSDPLLKIDIKADVQNGSISNIKKILAELEELKPAMYGEGRLFFSIIQGIDFNVAKAYGDESVLQGTYPYGAVAKNNNNCSRFITRMLIKSSEKFNHWHPINFPETIKASPLSNLVNTSSDRIIYSFTPEEGLKQFKMNRFQSFWFIFKQLGDNVISKKAALLPPDNIIGAMDFSHKPQGIPKGAMYLGGVGDGAWYHLENIEDNKFSITRYTSAGILEYKVIGRPEEPIPKNSTLKIAYDSHLLFTHVLYNGTKIRINHCSVLDYPKTEPTISSIEEYI